MRFAWISVLIVVLDQAFKWLIGLAGLNAPLHLSIGPAFIDILVAPEPPDATFNISSTNSTTLVLLAALLSIHLLLTRWSNQFHFISSRTLIALQLAGGGITAQAVDLAVRGDAYSSFQLGLDQSFVIQSSIADLTLMVGFILLLDILLRGRSRIRSGVTLSGPKLALPSFNHLPRGIDNIHVDVYLSPRFRKSADRLIHAIVPHTIQQLRQGKRKLTLAGKQFSEFRNDFTELFTAALRKAKVNGEKQLPNLLYVSILKYIHNEVNNAVAAQLQSAKEGNNTTTLRGLKVRSNSELIEWLFRFREDIAAQTSLLLLQSLHDDKNHSLQKKVRHFLGEKYFFSLQAMEAPLVLSGTATSSTIQMEHYLLLGQQQNERNSFVSIDDLLGDIFSEHLPLVEENEESADRVNGYLRSPGDINSNTIATLSQPSVLMHPGNIAILLDPAWTERKLKRTQKLKELKRYNSLRRHRYFQQRLLEKLRYVLKKTGLAQWVVNTYQVQELLKKRSSDISPTLLVSLLSRGYSEKEFPARMRETLKTSRQPPNEAAIQEIQSLVKKRLDKLLDQSLMRFIHNFAHYRRDLLLLLSYQRAAADITLISRQSDIDTSRANYSLYEFLHTSEVGNEHSVVKSHIIIKADLRGSTEVTERLNDLELNPATHFDRNFFRPINDVIESYGAEKVFIEGDAIILILNEHAGDSHDKLIAARACGLASRILQIVTRQNRELAAYGLPELELGIGVAYHDGAPRYLFDNQHRITISPAINRADRLSACTWSIREWRKKHAARSDYVEVYQPAGSAIHQGEKAQKDLVFNLNGILLEESVFQRLNRELTLKKVNNALQEVAESSLYAVHFPDLNGTPHSLVLRRAPLHHFDPELGVDDSPAVEGRYFHEVIWREETLNRLRKR